MPAQVPKIYLPTEYTVKLKRQKLRLGDPLPRTLLLQTVPLLPANRYFLFMRQLGLGFGEGMEEFFSSSKGWVEESLRTA